jgi:hypothetical protein
MTETTIKVQLKETEVTLDDTSLEEGNNRKQERVKI